MPPPAVTKDEEKIWELAIRKVTNQGDQAIDKFLTFFRERAAVEEHFVAALKKLIDSQSQSFESIWLLAYNNLGHVLQTRQTMHAVLIKDIIGPLEGYSKSRSKEVERHLGELVRVQVDSMTHAYKTKEDLQKLGSTYRDKARKVQESKEKDIPAKSAKYMKELNEADAEYRLALARREDERLRFEERRQLIIQRMALMEMDRVKRMGEAMKTYCQLEHTWATGSIMVFDEFKSAIEGIEPGREKSMYVRFLDDTWKPPRPIYYNELSEDYVFGVPLDLHLRSSKRQVPFILQKCIQAIEYRGLKREGIYRISSKLSDIKDLKVRLEKDLNGVNLEDDRMDVHVICGVVKLFFRELPHPLLDIPVPERTTFHGKSIEERVAMLQYWIKPEMKPTLKFLIFHLATVANFSDENKMTAQNLAVVFGPPILDGCRDGSDPYAPVETKSKAQAFMQKLEQAVNPESATRSPPQPARMESPETMMRNVEIVEHLILYRDAVFPPEKIYKKEKSSKSSTPKAPPAATEFPSRSDSLPSDKLPQPTQGDVNVNVNPNMIPSTSASFEEGVNYLGDSLSPISPFNTLSQAPSLTEIKNMTPVPDMMGYQNGEAVSLVGSMESLGIGVGAASSVGQMQMQQIQQQQQQQAMQYQQQQQQQQQMPGPPPMMHVYSQGQMVPVVVPGHVIQGQGLMHGQPGQPGQAPPGQQQGPYRM
ncbi:hypothetical protein HDU76_001091 [Blyttiomyces sp. JEL0837]|nr:hypothetical protein HDU76_001091 [Blyttiomyces sp. JEL0837]